MFFLRFGNNVWERGDRYAAMVYKKIKEKEQALYVTPKPPQTESVRLTGNATKDLSNIRAGATRYGRFHGAGNYGVRNTGQADDV